MPGAALWAAAVEMPRETWPRPHHHAAGCDGLRGPPLPGRGVVRGRQLCKNLDRRGRGGVNGVGRQASGRRRECRGWGGATLGSGAGPWQGACRASKGGASDSRNSQRDFLKGAAIGAVLRLLLEQPAAWWAECGTMAKWDAVKDPRSGSLGSKPATEVDTC